MPPTSAGVVRQRLMTAAAGLGVAALAGLAFALSYDDLRVLALTGGAAKGYAPFYPVMIDTLVVVTILSLVVARRTRWWARGVRWLLLLVLLTGAAAASTQRALNGYEPLSDTWLSAGVAIAPWAMLLIAVWLWLSMFRQARAALAARPAADAPPAPARSSTVRLVPTPAAAEEAEEKAADPIVPGLAAPEYTETDEGMNVPATLPTDVRLVTSTATPSETTQPDIVIPPRSANEDDDVETDTGSASAPEEPEPADKGADSDEGEDSDEDDVERWSALAAEDAQRWAEEAADTFGDEGDDESAKPKQSPTVEWIPPSSTFRSSPTPPRD